MSQNSENQTMESTSVVSDAKNMNFFTTSAANLKSAEENPRRQARKAQNLSREVLSIKNSMFC
jgi:hypothetical protein